MKILIIHTAFIGDIVLSTPLISEIRSKYPNSKIDYLTTPVGASVLKSNPNLNNIISYDKKGKNKGIKELLKLIKKLREKKYDMAIIPHRYLRSSLIAFLSGISEMVGYSNSGGRIFLTKKVKYKKDIHEVQRILRLIDKRDVNKNNTKIELFPGEKERAVIDRIWRENNLDNYKVLVIAPGSKWFTKKWPLQYYNKLIKKIRKNNGIKIILIGGPDERDLEIEDEKRVINVIGETSLLEVAEILKRSDILIGNDSSPLHIASAFDINIIAIFGATTETLGFFPWSEKAVVIENNKLDCRPCGLHGGNSCPKKHFKCMLDIKPDTVYEKIIEILKRGK